MTRILERCACDHPQLVVQVQDLVEIINELIICVDLQLVVQVQNSVERVKEMTRIISVDRQLVV